MNKFVSTFTQGCQDIVISELDKKAAKFQVTKLLDGVVSYTSTIAPTQISDFRFLNNTFLEIKEFEELRGDFFKPMIQWAVRHPTPDFIKRFIGENHLRTYKVVTFKDNKTVGYNPGLLKDIQFKLKNDIGIKLDKTNPDIEFWFFYQKGGYGSYGIRIAKKIKTTPLYKNVIRPELANIMCILSEQSEKDNILNPFAGSASIVLERALTPFNNIHTYINDTEIISKLKKMTIENLNIYNEDFFTNKFESESFTKIIGEIPWGPDANIEDVKQYYPKVLDEFNRLLNKNGIAVLLVGKETNVASMAEKYFSKVSVYSIQIAGKKVDLLKLGN